jgi:hypothetical protein
MRSRIQPITCDSPGATARAADGDGPSFTASVETESARERPAGGSGKEVHTAVVGRVTVEQGGECRVGAAIAGPLATEIDYKRLEGAAVDRGSQP